jgi:glycosyltransferase involved in cell wall biosynthesis
MRILLASGIFPPDIGGPATYIPKFAKNLSDSGHEVQILTLSDSLEPVNQSDFKVTYIFRKQHKVLRAIKIYKAISRIKPDYVFANGLHEEVAIWLRIHKVSSVAKIVGDPVWERYRNSQNTTISIQEFNSAETLRFVLRLQRKLLAWSLSTYSRITCPSKELCALVQNWNQNLRPVFIPNGTREVPAVETNKVYDLVTISRLVSWKNIDLVVTLANSKNLKLAIAGEGPEETALKVLSNPKLVSFLGQLDEAQVIEVLRQSKVFIQLSEYEGLSFALLQSLAVGTPSICSDIPGNSQIIENKSNGILVNNKNMHEIESAVDVLLNNESLRESVIELGIATIRDGFNENTQMAKMRKLLGVN